LPSAKRAPVKIVHRDHQVAEASRRGPEAVVVDSAVHARVAVDSAAHARVAADSAAHVPVAVDLAAHRPVPEVETGARISVLLRHRNGCAVRRRHNRNTSLADQSRNAPAVASTPWTISKTTQRSRSTISRQRRTRTTRQSKSTILRRSRTRASTIRMRNNRT
jgi:hypothetical protein